MLSVCLLTGLLPLSSVTAHAADNLPNANGANGSIDKPYIIDEAEDLVWLAEQVNNGNKYAGSYFLQLDNIDLGAINKWTPIGSDSTFQGMYNGNGFTISNLKYESTLKDAGLFGCVDNGSLSNIILKDFSITDTGSTGPMTVGALAGSCYGSVTGCHVIGKSSVTADPGSDLSCSAGGLIGSSGAAVSRCSSSAEVSSNNSYTTLGGVIGSAFSVSNCVFTGSVKNTAETAVNGIGGIAGYINESTILNTVKNCLSTGTITSKSKLIGGIVGNCYFSSGNGNAAASDANYYLFGTAVNAYGTYGSAIDHTSSVGVTAGAASVLRNSSTYLGWDFTNIWKNDTEGTSYPSLRTLGSVKTVSVNVSTPAKPVFNGTVLTDGGATVKPGLRYTRPGESSYTTVNASVTGTGNYTVSLSDLPEAVYYVQACADNCVGTAVGALSSTVIKISPPGSGTSASPFLIDSVEDLNYVRYDPTAYYQLTGDLDFSGKSFVPIGSDSLRFTGTFDGNGHSISGFSAAAAGDAASTYSGLFGYVGNGGTVKKLMVNGTYTGAIVMGGVAAYNYGAIDQCFNAGNLTSNEPNASVGGIAGFNGGAVSNCYNTGSISATDSNYAAAGGIVGCDDYFASGMSITACYNTGNISVGSSGYAAGIDAYSTSSVAGCFNAGTISGIDSSGSFNLAAVAFYEGGNNGNIISSDFLAQPGITIDGMTSGGGEGNSAYFTIGSSGAYTNFYTGAGWDFSSVWLYAANAYPLLRAFQKPPAITVTSLGGSGSTYGLTGICLFSIADSNFTAIPTAYTAEWCKADGTTAGAPVAGTLSVGTVTDGDAVMTLTPSATADAGTYYFKVMSGDTSAVTTFTIAKATASDAMRTAAVKVPSAGKTGASVTLLTLPAGAGYGSLTCSGIVVCSSITVSGTTITFDALTSTAGSVGMINLPVTGAKNYYDYNITVTVTSVAKTEVTITGLTAVNGIYSGSPVTGFTGTPAGYTGKLTYKYYLADGTTETTAANSGAASPGAAPVNAGRYQLIASVPENDADYTGSTSVNFAIDPAAVTVGAGSYRVSKVYDGTVSAGIAGGTLDVGGILSANSGVQVVPGTIPAYSAAAAGVYTLSLPVSLTGSGSSNYLLSAGTVSVPGEITKANPVYMAPTPNNVSYNHTLQPLLTAGSAANGTLQYSLNGTDWDSTIPTAMDAGSYTVYYRIEGDANYNDTVPQSVTAQITKLAGGVSVGLNGWTYGSPANTPVLTIMAGDYSASTFEYKLAEAADNAYASAVPTEAGSYTVRVRCEATTNYIETSATADFVIEPKTVTPSLSGSTSKIYDGTTAASGLTVALEGVLSGDTVTAVAASCAYSSKDAADTNLITASGIVLSGAKAGNYILSTDTVSRSGSIVSKALTVSGITAHSKVYDGTTAVVLITSGAHLEGQVASDSVGVTATGAFADQNTGTGKIVNLANLALTGNDAGNYRLSASVQQTSTTAAITPAVLTVNAVDKNKTYGEADPALTCEISGWQGSDSDSLLTGSLSRAAGEAVGSYNITVGTLSAGDNYTMKYTGASLTIGKAEVTLNVSVSPAAVKPGKTVTVTVHAVNSAAGQLTGGTIQPAGVTLSAPDGSSIVLTKPLFAPAGTCTGSYTIPQNTVAGSTLTFTAAVADGSGNYTNPSDQNAVLTVTAMSAVNLTLTADNTTGVIYGDSVTYTAQVEKANLAADLLNTLDGTVTFWLGNPTTCEQLAVRTIGTDALTVTLDSARLTKGIHIITAVYSGNAEFGTAQQNLATGVAAKTLSWDAGSLSSTKIFDGTLNAPITGELKVSGLVGSNDPGFTYDKAATTAAYADSNPGTGKTATITVAGAALANPNYSLPAEKPTFTGTVTAVSEIAAPTEAVPHGYQLKLEMETGLVSVPNAIIAADASLSSPEAVKARLQLRIENVLGTGSAAVKDFDLTLWISQNSGVTWEKATAENFPAGGITVVIPWSKLGLTYEQAQHYNFSVMHMFAAAVHGHTPGETESPAWTATAAGLQFKLDGLSPVAVGYKILPFITFEANGGSSVMVSAYTALSGKLASLPVPTRSGYFFRGWYTRIDGGDKITADTVFTANMTIYAHWNANESAAAVSISSTAADTGVISPRTGDNSHILLWGGLMSAGLFGLAATILLRRRRKQKNDC